MGGIRPCLYTARDSLGKREHISEAGGKADDSKGKAH